MSKPNEVDKVNSVLRKLIRRSAELSRGKPKLHGHVSAAKTHGWDPALISWSLGELADVFWDAYYAAGQILVPAHMPHHVFVEQIFDILDEATDPNSPSDLKSTASRSRRLAESLIKPLLSVEVNYVIDMLDVDEELVIDGIVFRRPGTEIIEKWKQEEGTTTVATVTVNAADLHAGFAVGHAQVVRALDRLRVAFASHSDGAGGSGRYKWRITGKYVVRISGDPDGAYVEGYKRPDDQPLVFPVAKALKAGLEDGGSGLSMLDDSVLVESIKKDFDRAVKWVAKSTVEDDPEEQVTQIATAFEILLIPDHDEGRKGELMAVRYNCLGGYMVPAGILGFYEDRSDVSHTGVETSMPPVDVWRMRLDAIFVLKVMLKWAVRHPEVSSIANLIPFFETPDALNRLIERIEAGTYDGPHIEDVESVAREQLKKVTPQT